MTVAELIEALQEEDIPDWKVLIESKKHLWDIRDMEFDDDDETVILQVKPLEDSE